MGSVAYGFDGLFRKPFTEIEIPDFDPDGVMQGPSFHLYLHRPRSPEILAERILHMARVEMSSNYETRAADRQSAFPAATSSSNVAR